MGKVINKGSYSAEDYKRLNTWIISYGQTESAGGRPGSVIDRLNPESRSRIDQYNQKQAAKQANAGSDPPIGTQPDPRIGHDRSRRLLKSSIGR
jgi:hypothetical protein